MAKMTDSALTVSVERDRYEIDIKLKDMISLVELESLMEKVSEAVENVIASIDRI